MTINRAVLLPTPGDPFLLKYWLENYAKYWKNEVSKLYVCLNTPMEKEVVDYEQELLERYGADFIYIDHQIEHGDALNKLLDLVKEDYVMLIEDDGYIFKRGQVDECFRYLETDQYDVVGGKRGSCSFEILEEAKNKWGLNYMGLGDQGPNFWPCYFFTKTEILKKTDRNFGARAWKRGEIIEPLNYLVNAEVVCGDTFVNTSLQLRAMGLRIICLPQYHGSPDDIKHYETKQNLWNGSAPWTHVGSLSSGVGGVLVNDIGVPLAKREAILEPKEFTVPPAGVDEWARRLQWWKTFYDNSDDKLPEFKAEYLKAIQRLQRETGVHDKLISQRQAIYRELGL